MAGLPLWVFVTLAASTVQTARNAMQHHLTDVLGTVGATQVRFLYGLPFAALFLPVVSWAAGEAPPAPTWGFAAFLVLGSVSQIVATGLMLASMRRRAFAVTIAYTKTEPAQVALFGLIVLGDVLSPLGAAAIVAATAGIVVMSWKPGVPAAEALRLGPALLGIASGAGFALAAVGFRGAILELPDGGFLIRATTTLVWSLALQTAILLVWLAALDRGSLMGSLRVWRHSLAAGFLGALASQLWFIAFALTAAANVRTLALVEVLFAAVASRRLFAETVSAREAAGMALVVGGVGLLLWSV